MADDTDTDDARRAPRSQRTALLVVGLLGAIVLGFAIGVLARIPLGDDGVPGADSVDVGFSQDMSVHHNQAVEMSAIAMTTAVDPAVRNLAYDILTTQQNQIGQMQGWLAMWDQPALPTGGYMGWMTEGNGGHGAHGDESTGHGAQEDPDSAGHGTSEGPMNRMPGMATSEDLAALRQASGTDVDVLFLQLMLRHHEGGLPMMEYGAQYASESVVRNIAQKMVDTQTSESELMTSMLAQRGAVPLPLN
ncbi:DUF305 domain-containing protein [Rhodococcus triatomae]|uniref:Uncharacterized conserved protein, DUF305 family n=1 Tax=Rhodococcus triatomae TaxID=300028 RepID=A0A1G8LW55_9NOCA|nr:DUF305 domain-containing protein [Rhodococcus triatomae]QNG18257.1 DUF305 domain-containing protein [Rhodococcus triatomae]QNG22072.1 DUF305 domain-containing protein [Rhodococcus triatomae]SDI59865.1 Uncharacterized conserved protein, DUF305 family [Rhodococcus triatomae]